MPEVTAHLIVNGREVEAAEPWELEQPGNFYAETVQALDYKGREFERLVTFASSSGKWRKAS